MHAYLLSKLWTSNQRMESCSSWDLIDVKSFSVSDFQLCHCSSEQNETPFSLFTSTFALLRFELWNLNCLAESNFGNIGKPKNPVVAAFNYQSPKSKISSPYISFFNASRNITHQRSNALNRGIDKWRNASRFRGQEHLTIGFCLFLK